MFLEEINGNTICKMTSMKIPSDQIDSLTVSKSGAISYIKGKA